VSRTALVSVKMGSETVPIIVYEPRRIRTIYPEPGEPATPEAAFHQIPIEMRDIASRHPNTKQIRHFLRNNSLPVDVRHNAKINRELLADWAAEQLGDCK